MVQDATEKLLQTQEKLDRLTRTFLNTEESIDAESYHTVRAELILQKNHLKAEKVRLQKKRLNHWIKRARNLILTLETLDTMAAPASPHQTANNLRKIGTNPPPCEQNRDLFFWARLRFYPFVIGFRALYRSARCSEPAR